MRRAGSIFVLILCALWCALGSAAQQQTQATNALSAAPVVGPATVKLGESYTSLNGPWKFHIHDDAGWAATDLDDSAWDSVDLTLPKGAIGVPGWTRRGYPGYAGFAWYRLRVNVQGAAHRLAIQMPDQADDAYQVFVNGQEIGEFGRFKGSKVIAFPGLPEAFALPRSIHDGAITIAVRMWMDDSTRFNVPDAGGLHGPPTLGYASLLNDFIQLEYDGNAHQFADGALVEVLILVMALLMTVTLFWLDPQEKGYLWLAFVCAVTLLGEGVLLSVNFAAWLPQTPAVLLNSLPIAARVGLWVLFWGYWFRIPQIRRVHRIVWPLVGLLLIGTAMLNAPLYGETVPLPWAGWIRPVLVAIKLGLGVLLFWIARRGFRTQKTEGWMAGLAVFLVFIANYQHELQLIHVPIVFVVLGFTVYLGTFATVCSLLIITVMLLRRFIQAQALKEQWKMEIQQAQQVQQVLIPHELPRIPGLTIDSEYRPAREVGGDFFQIIPLETPGSVLILVGDVTGKGMQAGMLVALIVGAVRAAVQHSIDPANVLHEVNDQLCERGQAIATCMMMRIDPGGEVTVANAGQLPPYLNGVEMEFEGAFPLGMVPDVEYTLTNFALQPGDSLFLMSDGVVEATDPEGTLFGFERVAELLKNKASSAAIAEDAQQFGQEDDILVLQIWREGAGTEPSLDEQHAGVS